MNKRRIISAVIAVIMLIAVIPMMSIAENTAELINETDSIGKLDRVWAKLEAAEADAMAANLTKSDVINSVFNAALNSMLVDADSISDVSEDGFLFTVDGMYNYYNYKLRNELNSDVKVEGKTTVIPGDGTRDASAADVLLVGPYYGGYDDSFTDQYFNEATSVAAATGGNLVILEGHGATGPAIAENFTRKGIIFYDSHGVAVGGSSYLCLTTNEGITSEDYSNGWAVRSGSEAFIDGRYIEHHISEPASNSIVWMAICEGMKKSGNGVTAEAFLRAGVEVVYGYSQSVTFIGDYMYETVFWNHMKEGETVADSIAAMKDEYGVPDPYGDAYPIVVSADDPYPTNPDADQVVVSQYTIYGELDPIALDDISISTDTISISVGDQFSVQYDREPTNANQFDAVWTSTNPDVVTYYKGSKAKAVLVATGVGEADVTCNITVDGNVIYTHTIHVSVDAPYDLSAANAAGTNLVFGTSGDYVFEAAEKDGIRCVRSGNYHKLSSTSQLNLALNMKAGETISFDYLVSSQVNKDYCKFTINGSEIFKISGTNNDWNSYSFTADEDGIYVFEWKYVKDASQSQGDDRVFIANVAYDGETSAPTLPGDVNGDGVVNAADANLAMRMAVSLMEPVPAADVNGDNSVTAADANIIMRMALNLM